MGMKRILFFILVIIISCATPVKTSMESKAHERLSSLDADSQNQIKTLLNMIEEQARFINSSEIHYIPYEFRIPFDSGKKKEIQRIDPTVSFTKRDNSYLCIGENATGELVFKILALPYTYKIRFCPFE
jgi:hypothetical protein